MLKTAEVISDSSKEDEVGMDDLVEVEFEEGADPKAVMPVVLENCKKVEDDCEIFF